MIAKLDPVMATFLLISIMTNFALADEKYSSASSMLPVNVNTKGADATLPADKKCKVGGGVAEDRVIILHIKKASITEGDCQHCIMYGHRKNTTEPNDEDDDENGLAEKDFSPDKKARPISYDNGNWATPFDFNLDKQNPHPTNHSTLVEVVLDDNDLSFMNDATDPKNPQFALLVSPKADSTGLFDCLRDFKQDKNGVLIKKLRFHINYKVADENPVSAGFNIGILVDTQKKSGPNEIYVPLYIDPHPQNGG